MTNIEIQEVNIKEVVKINTTIIEFNESLSKEYFENKYHNKNKLIIIAYIDKIPAGYIVGYKKNNDKSFYCWMAGVDPKFRKMGVLKELMNYQDIWARKRNYKKITITTRNNRREMLSYLVKYNFLFTKIKQFPDINENRVMLEKKL